MRSLPTDRECGDACFSAAQQFNDVVPDDHSRDIRKRSTPVDNYAESFTAIAGNSLGRARFTTITANQVPRIDC